MSEIAQGLQLSVYGILITFASLGLLIVVMIILRELFNPRKDASVEEDQESISEATEDDLQTDLEMARRRAAGIAVSVAYMNSLRKRGANLGQLLESPPSHWWSASKRSQNE